MALGVKGSLDALNADGAHADLLPVCYLLGGRCYLVMHASHYSDAWDPLCHFLIAPGMIPAYRGLRTTLP